VHLTGIREQFSAIADALALAQGIVDTVREPVLVLDEELRVIAASRSFYSAFKVTAEDTQGKLLYALGDGQWDIPALRLLLETIIPSGPPWRASRSSMFFPISAAGPCF